MNGHKIMVFVGINPQAYDFYGILIHCTPNKPQFNNSYVAKKQQNYMLKIENANPSHFLYHQTSFNLVNDS